MAYRAKTGPLDAGSKLEAHLATLQAMIVQAMGGEATPDEFLYGTPEQPDEAGIDMNQAVNAFKLMGAM